MVDMESNGRFLNGWMNACLMDYLRCYLGHIGIVECDKPWYISIENAIMKISWI